MRPLPDISHLDPPRDFIGYGSRPPKVVWPGGANVAVNIAINYEEGSEFHTAAGDPYDDPGAEVNFPAGPGYRDFYVESCFEYGSRAGIWRYLNLLAEYEVQATIFGCGVAFERNPAIGPAIVDGGHDVCAHGWRWSSMWKMTEEEERLEISSAVASIEKVWGQRPRGWYAKMNTSPRTRRLLLEEGGFSYDSDAYNDDLPYYVSVSGVPGGQQLVLPYTLTYNDMHFIIAEGGYGSPSDFVDLLRRGFDELWIEGERGHPKMMSIGLHPRWAQAARVSAVREFVEHALGRGQVWFAPRGQIADWWSAHHEEFEQ